MVEIDFARGDTGESVHIKDASKADAFTCILCDESLHPKQGMEKAWHFAHYADASCVGGETALHKMSKTAIKHYFDLAIADKRPYKAFMMCSFENHGYTGDLTLDADQVFLEKTLTPRLRPDLTFYKNGEVVFTVEVVVTHSPEESAINEYEEIGIPGIIYDATWERYPRLVSQVAIASVVSGRDLRCPEHPPGYVPPFGHDWTFDQKYDFVSALINTVNPKRRSKKRKR